MTAVTAGDADPALERLSEHPGAVTIGTDPDEWWYGHGSMLLSGVTDYRPAAAVSRTPTGTTGRYGRCVRNSARSAGHNCCGGW